MNKKIGLLNFHYSDHNYGAVLQAAALADVVTQLGYNTEHVDFIPAKIEKKKTPRQRLVAVLAVLGIKSLLKRILGIKVYIKPQVTGSEVFEKFRTTWIVRSAQTYTAATQLNEIGTTYAAVVVGSDQVWRPHPDYPKEHIDAYFLGFLPREVTRISYAASFGVDKWEYINHQDYTETARDSLQLFSHISVRENSGVNLCKDVFSVDALHVLDPTLLRGRDFFEKIISHDGACCGAASIVYYKLDVDDWFVNQVNSMGSDFNAEVENIYYMHDGNGYRYIPVPDWLAKIRDSKLVITDSYHCVCFSILFNREFICISNPGRGLARLTSLLHSLGITDRVYDDKISISDVYNNIKKIDYEIVNLKLNQLRVDSMSYLIKALDGVK